MYSRILAVSLIIVLSLSSNNICYAHGGGGGGGHCGGHCCGEFHRGGLHIASSSPLFGNHYYGGYYPAWTYSIFHHFHRHHYLQYPYLYNNSLVYWPSYFWPYPFYASLSGYMAGSMFWPPYYMNPYYPYSYPYLYPYAYPPNTIQPIYPPDQSTGVSSSLNQFSNNQNTQLTNTSTSINLSNDIGKNTENEHDYSF